MILRSELARGIAKEEAEELARGNFNRRTSFLSEGGGEKLSEKNSNRL